MDVFEAIYKGDFNSVKIFLEKGGDVNTIDDSDYTALSMAALMGQSNIVKLLKKYGAKTDLQMVLDKGNNDIAGLLKNAGAE